LRVFTFWYIYKYRENLFDGRIEHAKLFLLPRLDFYHKIGYEWKNEEARKDTTHIRKLIAEARTWNKLFNLIYELSPEQLMAIINEK
tara:strand:- start:5272 stop:5532 length:261 start_codon:yes stop_codon:yes gene_type:complete